MKKEARQIVKSGKQMLNEEMPISLNEDLERQPHETRH